MTLPIALFLVMYVLSIVGMATLVALFEQAIDQPDDDVCMCGEPVDKHGPRSGHVAVSMRDYYGDRWWQ